jgi:hypothetical protein
VVTVRMCPVAPRFGGSAQREADMLNTLRRIAIALGALATLALAGGAHFKAG